MEVNEFKRFLDNGHGRAAVFLKTYSAFPYRDVILEACLHNMALDRQIEGSRAEYMFEIIYLTGQHPFYRAQILKTLAELSDTADDYDVQQLYGLARLFAFEGDIEAKQTIYDKFSTNMPLGNFAGANQIILLDGWAGFLFIADKLGQHLIKFGDDFPVDERHYSLADEGNLRGLANRGALRGHLYRLDKKPSAETIAAINEARAANPNIEAYMATAAPEWDGVTQVKPLRPPKIDPSTLHYDEIKENIARKPLPLARWGKIAPDSELEQAAKDLLSQTDPRLLRQYLWIFGERRFPLDFNYLVTLVDHPDNYVAIAAINALAAISEPAIRAFALTMIARRRWTGRMVGLLVNNFQPGDWQLIETLSNQDLDREDYYALGFSVLDVFDIYPVPESVKALLNIYERVPYSWGREHIVDRLCKLGPIPDWMREECLHDSNEYLRAKAQRNFEPELDKDQAE